MQLSNQRVHEVIENNYLQRISKYHYGPHVCLHKSSSCYENKANDAEKCAHGNCVPYRDKVLVWLVTALGFKLSHLWH